MLVVDGSPDDSLAVCRRLAAELALPITVVNHSRDYGERNWGQTNTQACARPGLVGGYARS